MKCDTGNRFCERQPSRSFLDERRYKSSIIKGYNKTRSARRLDIPVTTKHHVKIPSRYNAVFEVNLHGNCEGTKIISANKQLMEANLNVFQHKISVKREGNKYFPFVTIKNLDQAKMHHLAKGQIVGFAHDEEVEMNYIEMTNTLEMQEIEQRAPRNWIPERSWRNYKENSEISPEQAKVPEVTDSRTQTGKISLKIMQKSDAQCESSNKEGFDTDFLISLGNVYLNRKVKLEDAEITAETRRKFEEMCDRHTEAFSKNNKDIGRTTLVEMEIDI